MKTAEPSSHPHCLAGTGSRHEAVCREQARATQGQLVGDLGRLLLAFIKNLKKVAGPESLTS